jgi:hypothetical protein
MGRRASPWSAILTGPEQVLGTRWLSLFRSAPRPVQQALLTVGRHAPGRSVRRGNLRRLRPFSNRYGYDRRTPVERYCIEPFLDEHAGRIHGDVLEVKGANYSRRFGHEVRCHVVDIDPENTEADLHADLACVAALWGLSVQDLSAEELDVNDPCFPLVACAHADKPA